MAPTPSCRSLWLPFVHADWRPSSTLLNEPSNVCRSVWTFVGGSGQPPWRGHRVGLWESDGAAGVGPLPVDLDKLGAVVHLGETVVVRELASGTFVERGRGFFALRFDLADSLVSVGDAVDRVHGVPR